MPAPSTDKQFIDWLDKQAEAFGSATTLEHYLNYSGQKEDLVLAPIFKKHARLFSRATVDRVLKTKSKDERLPNIRESVVDGYLDQAAKGLTEQLAARETADTIRWDRKRVPYRSVSLYIMNEADPARRHALDTLRVEATASQNGIRQQRWGVLYERTHDLGFDNYVQLCDRLGVLQLETLRATMERFLSDTESAYRDRLQEELRAIDVVPAHAERSDLARLFRQPKFDGAFPRDRMLPALGATLRGLGIDVDNQPNVHTDAEERPKKSPRAFCAAAHIPGEIYLVIAPHGGHDDYRALFHEAGHAQHFAHVAPDMPYAFRGQGDNSVTEGFAFVLEHLLYNRAWLQQHLGMEDAGEYLSFVRFHKLYFIRRYAAKLLYELQLHTTADVPAMGKRYADLLTAHVGVRHSPEDYLSDLDDGFYCARYLRAWMFDAQVRSWFDRSWGEGWFAIPEAGDALRELWSHGQRYRAEELLKRIGETGPDIAPLAAELV